MELAAATEDANQTRQELRVVRAELARSRAQQATVCCPRPTLRCAMVVFRLMQIMRLKANKAWLGRNNVFHVLLRYSNSGRSPEACCHLAYASSMCFVGIEDYLQLSPLQTQRCKYLMGWHGDRRSGGRLQRWQRRTSGCSSTSRRPPAPSGRPCSWWSPSWEVRLLRLSHASSVGKHYNAAYAVSFVMCMYTMQRQCHAILCLPHLCGSLCCVRQLLATIENGFG